MYQIYFSCLVLSFPSVCLLCLSKLQYGITDRHFENWSNLENLVHLAQIQIKSISVESSFFEVPMVGSFLSFFDDVGGDGLIDMMKMKMMLVRMLMKMMLVRMLMKMMLVRS